MKIGIYGYGNLGRGVENAVLRNPDMELAAVFTRRDPGSVTIATPDVPVPAACSGAGGPITVFSPASAAAASSQSGCNTNDRSASAGDPHRSVRLRLRP